MGVDDHGSNSSTLHLYWWIRNFSVPLEFLPSHAEVVKYKSSQWVNGSWIDQTEYLFSNLKAYTTYNLTVYVRVKGQKDAYPPAKYVLATTGEGGEFKIHRIKTPKAPLSGMIFKSNQKQPS